MAIFLTVVILLTGCAQRGESDRLETNLIQSETTDQANREDLADLAPVELNLIQFEPPQPGDLIAVMETTMGTIHIRLFPQYAPLAVENFVGLAGQGFYNDSNFHRVINDFMIQGGASNPDGSGATSIFRDENGTPQPFADEFTVALWHFRGALSMANPGSRDSNMSQFFIMQDRHITPAQVDQMRSRQYPEAVIDRYIQTGGRPHLDWGHTVFGHVIEGMDVVDTIAGAATDSSNDRPLEDVLIRSLTFEYYE